MNKLLVTILLLLFSTASFAQIVKQGEKFADVTVVDNKVVFLKEISFQGKAAPDEAYKKLKTWAANQYGRDPFISGIRYDARNKEFTAKSRIELILPENSKGVTESIVMRYRINGFIFQNRYVFEITDISYVKGNSKTHSELARKLKAEESITDTAVGQGSNQEFRSNLRKSTIYFLNELNEEIEKAFAY